jgi:hypothetical protein
MTLMMRVYFVTVFLTWSINGELGSMCNPRG